MLKFDGVEFLLKLLELVKSLFSRVFGENEKISFSLRSFVVIGLKYLFFENISSVLFPALSWAMCIGVSSELLSIVSSSIIYFLVLYIYKRQISATLYTCLASGLLLS